MELSGPNGKPMQKPEARRMPTRQEKFNMIYMMVTLMTSVERRMLKKSLRPLIRELDLKYPMGMSEGDMKHDLEKAANEIVPEEQGHAIAPDAESPAQSSVSPQLQVNEGGPETAPSGAL